MGRNRRSEGSDAGARGRTANERVLVQGVRDSTGASMIGFTQAARQIGAAAGAAGLTVPAFRSPPRRTGAVRTIRRLPGGPVVAVRLVGRPLGDVIADLVEGVVVANELSGDGASRVRRRLVQAAAASVHASSTQPTATAHPTAEATVDPTAGGTSGAVAHPSQRFAA